MRPGPRRAEGWSTESSLIRPYSLTGGRTRPSREDLTVTTQVVALPSVALPELDPELELILRVCARPVSVAEVAARSGFPLGVLRVLLSDLVDQGRVRVRTSDWERRRPDARTLRSVLDRIREL
ncbi:DUF742 domain-containing protein [Nocardiopsis sp. MG754419]|uniref:DUF742 domain-containing protein n=1 Tax=Nocardiopsis sp. MG754419 TaxID=2259865 RepID=UPI001BAA1B9B|nr:DUF742 domain-containing protein [Nocardiopsis sp. MG754419]MBR8745344.1 hypothetical protein [Nocardiopsis sp. MG754419]